MFETPFEATCMCANKEKYQDGQSSTLIRSRCSPFIFVRPGLVPNFPRPLPPEMWRPQTSTSLMFLLEKITLKQMGVFAQIVLPLSFTKFASGSSAKIFKGILVLLFFYLLSCLFLWGNSWTASRTASFSHH